MIICQYQILRNEDEINELCDKFFAQGYISVDTEFFTNKKSKKFVLSLIQICCDGLNYIIDINDFTEIVDDKKIIHFPKKLREVFENKNIIKVFHAYQQDFEILKNDLGIKIKGIFDTQIGMMFLHAEELYSYQSLVHEFLKVKIDKAHQMDDWQVRPLTQEQLNYAALDVFYLYQIYPMTLEKLKKKGKLEWMMSYMEEIENEKGQKISSEDLVEKYNINLTEKSKYLIIKELIDFFHDNEIESLNLIKNIVEAKNLTVNRLQHIFKSSKSKIDDGHYQKILDITKLEYDENDLNDLEINGKKKSELSYDQSHIFLLLKYILRKASHEHHVSSRLIADKNDLLNLLLGRPSKLDKKDWRYGVFGKRAIDFLNGNLNFSCENGKLKFL